MSGNGSAKFELPSTSGRDSLQFDLVNEPGGLRLRATYLTSVYGGVSIEPTLFTYVPPPIEILREDLEALMSRFRLYGSSMVSREAQGKGTVFVVSHKHRLAMRLEPGGPERGIAGWQALFSFQVIAGPSLTFSGGYVVDVTCLDIFDEGLAACLASVQEQN